jgi:hypothetical protein
MSLPALQAQEATEADLVAKLLTFYADPLGFVLFIFPWLEPNTPLEIEDGPDKWQKRFLDKLGRAIRDGYPAEQAIRMATASGHGVGKTAMVAWIILWFMSTRPNPQVVVTANTYTQLTTKTWRELAKWQMLAHNGHWFDWTATQLKLRRRPELWFATAVPWSASHAAAFAGTHEKHVLMVFDEASEIEDIIWETAEGAMTTPGAIWLCFGNPTQNTGRFRQCWTKFRKRWLNFRVDSRTAKKADKKQLEDWIEDYGIDSDFVRVRVLGKFPAAGPKQLIPNDRVEAAVEREIDEREIPDRIPRLMGIDVGSYGNAETVLILRQGPKMKKDIFSMREADVVKVAGWIGEKINDWHPDIVFIDAGGYGHAVYLLLAQRGFNVSPCYAGNQKRVLNKKVFYNPRIEWWWRMREWLNEADIPDHQQLFDDLISPEYSYDVANRMRLEPKESMMRRGIASPDYADALSVTFAVAVPVKEELSNFSNAEDLEPEVE